MFIIFDTETTGLPRSYKAPISDSDNWPRLVQLAWQVHDETGKLLSNHNYIVKPEGFDIPYSSQKIHGISTERALKEGLELKEVLNIFNTSLLEGKYNVGHNIEFDINIMGAEFYRLGIETPIMEMPSIDTKNESTNYCAIPGGRGGKFKWPTLTELHTKLFGIPFADAHDAAYDVDATAKCFFGLVTNNVIKPVEVANSTSVVYEAPVLDVANFAVEEETESANFQTSTEVIEELVDVPFTHLHCHTQFSILQATTDVHSLVATAKKLNMTAIAMTDHGNMMGAFHFVREALKEDIKPIVGTEINICRNHADKSVKDDGYQTVLLAKNKAGYHNLAKLSSKAHTDGFYYVPRIDKDLVIQFKENLIATTGGLWGEIPSLILNVGEAQAEEAFLWWKQEFGEDFYAEISRHGVEEEDVVNKVLLRFCEKHKVKYFASNNTYYSVQEDAKAHDTLLCVKDAEYVSKPKKYIGKRGREFRYGFPNDEFYIKPADEMKVLFADYPEAIKTTQEISDKIEKYELARDVLLPAFEIPEQFQDAEDVNDGGKRGENNYLRHLTYEGAKERYEEITDDIRERLDFELNVIANTGYPGYFLIVQDFIAKAREMGVSVGPGRGSAAGSAVAYCVSITNIDPIAYDLLFERFLNPDRISMPDIDIDFDDEGRQSVIDYVIDKYGSNQVAQIITYGSMAAKSSIRDTARVLELPLSEADILAKQIPEGIKLAKIFSLDEKELKAKLKGNSEEIEKAKNFKKQAAGNNLQAETINLACKIEGSLRNTGIHACGVIITPDDITNYVPVARAKDGEMNCTQFDNSVVEDAGLLKMDFLGLKTLTLIKHAVENVKKQHGITINPDEIPLDDVKTYELFQRGETIGIFQYESPGMQKHLKGLKPTVFADLIAMNALYRPGPMEYIPSFIKRKHGEEDTIYDLDACEEYLQETYGITVYQEQVMLLSQKLADFTKGEADTLRKAMGKKQKSVLDKMKPKFIEQATAKQHDPEKLEKIWKDWEAFAEYAFNKSHSTCYAWIAFQTAYFKANYPAEYMASVLSNNMRDIKSVTFFMEECKRMGIEVLGPSVNESAYAFTVNKEGQIRFGMGGIKGVGQAAINSIVVEREKKGNFIDLHGFFKRASYDKINKKTTEALALAGAYDEFEGVNRSMFFADVDGQTYLERAMKFGSAYQEALDAPPDLFGGIAEIEVSPPPFPICEPWSRLKELAAEKDVVGMYISGHPLNDYKYEIDRFCNTPLSHLKELEKLAGKELKFCGIISSFQERIDKRGNPFGRFTLEDYTGTFDFMLFRDDYTKFRSHLSTGAFLYVQATSAESRWREGQHELKLTQINYLSEVLEKKVKELSIAVRAEHINDILIADINSILPEEAGTARLHFEILTESGVSVKLPSKKRVLKLNSDVLEKLSHIENIEIRLN